MSVKIQEHINIVNDPATQKALQNIFEVVDTEIDALRTLVNELRTWAGTLATKMNSDAGITDTDYDATITAPAITEGLTS